MPFVWSIGTIIGPAIGGYFADPSVNFPAIFSPDGLFGRLPYLLPNLICSVLLLFSLGLAYLFLVETHPDMQAWSTKEDLKYSTAHTPLMQTGGAMTNAPADIAHESYGTFDSVQISESSRTEDERKANSRDSSMSRAGKEKAFTRPVIMLVIAMGM